VLRSPGVFFEPPHELHWYEALGYEARALRAASAAERDRARARALASWQAFLEEGGGSGPWADIARARRRALEETR
ncbi:MAG: hypothetical protein NZ898_14640, partial [Myxococcota bacterium]|nr:hypothetical protein [Myxococcota bacterium]